MYDMIRLDILILDMDINYTVLKIDPTYTQNILILKYDTVLNDFINANDTNSSEIFFGTLIPEYATNCT